jgi:hypothetical protein
MINISKQQNMESFNMRSVWPSHSHKEAPYFASIHYHTTEECEWGAPCLKEKNSE